MGVDAALDEELEDVGGGEEEDDALDEDRGLPGAG